MKLGTKSKQNEMFKYEATELPVIKYEDEIWFEAVAIATIFTQTNVTQFATMLTPKTRENCQNWCPNPNRTIHSV